jgi:hypothetical protein
MQNMIVRYVISAMLPVSRSDPTGAIRATAAGMTAPRERRSDGSPGEGNTKQPSYIFPQFGLL